MPNYYDPTTFGRVDPTRVRTVGGWEGGPDRYYTGDMTAPGDENPSYGTEVNAGSGIDAWGRSQGFNGGGGFGTETSRYLNSLQDQYGLGVNDFQRALDSYHSRAGSRSTDQRWWEDQATGRAFADSLGRTDPRYSTGWTNNAGLERTQQGRIGGVLQDIQRNDTGIGGELKTLGMLAGVAAGGVGLAGLAGVGGAAAGAGALGGELGAAGGLFGGELGLAGVQAATPTFAQIGAGAAAGGGAIPGGLDSYFPDLPQGPGPLQNLTPQLPNEFAPPEGLPPTGPTGPSLPNLPPTPPTNGFQGTDDLASQAASANSGINPYTAQISSLPTSLLSSLAQTLGISESTLRTLGTLGLGLGDLIGRSQTNNAAQSNADRAFNMGAPYRDRLAAYYANPGAAIAADPAIQASVRQGTDALARSLSARDGNPVGSGRALSEMQNYATNQLYGQYGNELNRLANFGGLSSFNAAAPGLATNAANSSGDIYSSIGNTIGRVLNPPQTLAEQLAQLRGLNGVLA